MNKIAAGNLMFSDVHKHVKLHVRTGRPYLFYCETYFTAIRPIYEYVAI